MFINDHLLLSADLCIPESPSSGSQPLLGYVGKKIGERLDFCHLLWCGLCAMMMMGDERAEACSTSMTSSTSMTMLCSQILNGSARRPPRGVDLGLGNCGRIRTTTATIISFTATELSSSRQHQRTPHSRKLSQGFLLAVCVVPRVQPARSLFVDADEILTEFFVFLPEN